MTARTDARPEPRVQIVGYRTSHRDAFRDLNLEWITTHFAVEAADRKMLDDPEETILLPGGQILMAEEEGRVLGTCALLRLPPDGFELAKMAVTPAARGRGIGELLGRAAIERARTLGARRVELVSNTRLQAAIRLYRRLGFVEAPLDSSEYRRADIRMILRLEARPEAERPVPAPPEAAVARRSAREAP